MNVPAITWRDFNRLEAIEWAEDEFGSLITTRQFPRRAILRLVERGLVRSAGLVTVLDGDGGMVEPERFREGFKLTDAGKQALTFFRAGGRSALERRTLGKSKPVGK